MAVLAPVLVLSMGLAACSTSSGVTSVEANQIDPSGTDPSGTDPAAPTGTGTLDWGGCDDETADIGVEPRVRDARSAARLRRAGR